MKSLFFSPINFSFLFWFSWVRMSVFACCSGLPSPLCHLIRSLFRASLCRFFRRNISLGLCTFIATLSWICILRLANIIRILSHPFNSLRVTRQRPIFDRNPQLVSRLWLLFLIGFSNISFREYLSQKCSQLAKVSSLWWNWWDNHRLRTLSCSEKVTSSTRKIYLKSFF